MSADKWNQQGWREYAAEVNSRLNSAYADDPKGFIAWRDHLRSLKPGQEFSIRADWLFPASDEWDVAKAGESRSDGPIEVRIKNEDEVVVWDGHNRLKTALANGVEFVTVKLVK